MLECLRIIFLHLCVLSFVLASKVEAHVLQNDQGLNLVFDDALYKKTKDIRVNGVFSIFVNCGSQYALWYQFPASIRYTLTDLDSGAIYFSVDNELSISWSDNQVYEAYAKEPCNQIISKTFSVLLNDIYFQNVPRKKINHFKLQAEYAGQTSNPLTFKGVLFDIKSW